MSEPNQSKPPGRVMTPPEYLGNANWGTQSCLVIPTTNRAKVVEARARALWNLNREQALNAGQKLLPWRDVRPETRRAYLAKANATLRADGWPEETEPKKRRTKK